MPLFIIAIVFLIGLLIYVITGYATGISEKPSINFDFKDKIKKYYPHVDFEVSDDDTTGFENSDYSKQAEKAEFKINYDHYDHMEDTKQEENNETQGL